MHKLRLTLSLEEIKKAYSLRPDQLAWDLKSPCNDCPFLKSSPFHEGVASGLAACMESIEQGIFAHTCHKTDTRDGVDGPLKGQVGKGPIQHCAGALLMLLRTGKGKDLQLPLLKAAEAGKFDLADMMQRAKKATGVYRVMEMVRFYLREMARRRNL